MALNHETHLLEVLVVRLIMILQAVQVVVHVLDLLELAPDGREEKLLGILERLHLLLSDLVLVRV